MGQYFVGLVGESNYHRAVARLRGGDPIALEHEPGNTFDPLAVRAIAPSGETVGYLARDSWLRELVHQGAPVLAAVKSVEGSPGKLGVVLDVATKGDPLRVLGAEDEPAPGTSAIRSGVAGFVKGAKGGAGCAVALAFLGAGILGLSELRAAPPAWELTPAKVERDARGICAAKWPDNLALRAACVRNAREGAESFRQIAARRSASRDMQRSLARCYVKWTHRGVTNYALLGGCARNNEDALVELGN